MSELREPRGFVSRFLNAWRTRVAAVAGERIGVGVSGGIDSCVLAVLLHRLRKHLGIRHIVLLHLDHGIRPRAHRAADIAVLRELAARIRAPLIVRRARVRAGSAGLEAAGRAARLKFFESAARRHRLDCVALGHHLDDRIETFFLFLLRGSGLRGLSSMRPSEMIGGIAVVRPLLPFDRAEIGAFAKSAAVRHHEDVTNEDPRFLRNRVRRELVPLIRSMQAGFTRTMSAAFDAIESDDAVLAQMAADIFQFSLVSRRARKISLDRGKLRFLPPGILARVLYLADRESGGSGSMGGHDNLAAATAAVPGIAPFSLNLPDRATFRLTRAAVEFLLPARRGR